MMSANMTTPGAHTPRTPSHNGQYTPKMHANGCNYVSFDEESHSSSETSLFDISVDISENETSFSSENGDSHDNSDDTMSFNLDNVDLDSLRKQCTRLMQLLPLKKSSNSSCLDVGTTRKRPFEEYERSSSSSDDASSTVSNTSPFDCSILSNNDDMSLSSDSDMSLCLSEASLIIDEESLSSLKFEISLDNSDDASSLSSENDDSLIYSDDDMTFDLDNVDLESSRKTCVRLIPFVTLNIPSNSSYSDVVTTQKRQWEEYEYSSSDDDSTTSSETSLFDKYVLSNKDDISLSSDSDMSICLSEASLIIDEETLSSLEFEISLDNSDDESSLSSESDDSLVYSDDEMTFDLDNDVLELPRKTCTGLLPLITLNNPSNASYSEVATTRKCPLEEYEFSSSDDDTLTSSETSLFHKCILSNKDDLSLSSDSDMSICLSDDDISLDLDDSHFDGPRRVHFPFDLVTEVRFRPRTEQDQVAMLFSNQNDWNMSIKEYRKEKRAFMMEKEQGSRCACDKVTKVHYYQGGTPILEEIAFEEALKDTTSENGIESRFAQALNNCSSDRKNQPNSY